MLHPMSIIFLLYINFKILNVRTLLGASISLADLIILKLLNWNLEATKVFLFFFFNDGLIFTFISIQFYFGFPCLGSAL